MELRLRLVPDAGSPCDVIVEVDADHTVADLAVGVSRYVGGDGDRSCLLVIDRSGAALDPSELVSSTDLRSGDTLLLDPAALPASREPPRQAVTADVVTGPDAGRWMTLQPGRYRIGRHPECDLVLTDRSVSRDHIEVLVRADWTVTVAPVAPLTNAVTVDDEAIVSAAAVAPEQVVGLGATRLVLRPFRRPPVHVARHFGHVDFHPTPYRAPQLASGEAVVCGPIPERPQPRRLQLIAAIAPLAGGLAMYVFSRQTYLLVLTAISPIVIVATALSDRRSGRARHRAAIRRFSDDLARHRVDLDGRRRHERIERWRAAPDLAELARRAELTSIDLWQRGRGAPDLLCLRLGVGPSPVLYTIGLEDGGDPELRDRLASAIDGFDRHREVPVMVDLVADPVLAVHGPRQLVDGVAAALAIQLATLHSPRDVVLVPLLGSAGRLDFLKWLPHARCPASLPRGAGGDWPRVVAIVAGRPALLDLAGREGVSVIWLASSPGDVPPEARHVLAVGAGEDACVHGELWSAAPDLADRPLLVEVVRPAVAERVARSLAQVRDHTRDHGQQSSPSAVSLYDALGVAPGDSMTVDSVARRWRASAGPGLGVPVGVGAAGRVELDLVGHGPHALIAGTSGAGKSELLQSLVAALAISYPPSRVTLMFVDYKGGAAGKVFERLPHVVGNVTNLDDQLAERAITSLRAELDRRMRIMEGRAKDLRQLLDIDPLRAPPALVIVIDEFATVAREVPGFVAGVIDIAQRGRSLGIHLVLATQRPAAVDDNILANTNLRICLRTVDRAESVAIIDSAAAAAIPAERRGRAVARIGTDPLIEFQCAFGGVRDVGGGPGGVVVSAFDGLDHGVDRRPHGEPVATERTQLDAVIDSVVAAHARSGCAAPRRPWRELLPDVVTLDALMSAGARYAHGAASVVVAGLIDAPEQQDQFPLVVDLEQGGGWMIFGSPGAGATTLLRTTAASIAMSGADVALLGFDFASGDLNSVACLPQVVDVAAGDDLEAVTRQLVTLDAELARRKASKGSATAPRVIVLIDDFGAMAKALADTGPPDRWLELLQRVVIDGRRVGIHSVFTADRRAAVPPRIHAAVSNRLVLRLADHQAYAEHGIGIDRARRLHLPNGRGLWQARHLAQVASISDDPSAEGQALAIAELARRHDRERTRLLPSAALPDALALADLGRRSRGSASPPCRWAPAIGVADVTGEVVAVDLATSHLAIVGPRGSGRSTALRTIAAGVGAGNDVHVLARHADAVVVFDRLLDETSCAGSPPRLLLIDDVDALDDSGLQPRWARLIADGRVRVVASAECRSLAGYTAHPILAVLRRASRMLVLRPDDPTRFHAVTGLKLSLRPGVTLPPGRAVLVDDRRCTAIQVAAEAAHPPPID